MHGLWVAVEQSSLLIHFEQTSSGIINGVETLKFWGYYLAWPKLLKWGMFEYKCRHALFHKPLQPEGIGVSSQNGSLSWESRADWDQLYPNS